MNGARMFLWGRASGKAFGLTRHARLAMLLTAAAFGPGSYSGTIEKTVAAGGVLTVDAVAQPAADGTGGIARAWVPTGGVSATDERWSSRCRLSR